MAIKAVIFDYGAVLSLPPAREDRERMAALFGVSVEDLARVYYLDRLNFDRADITAEQYWLALSARLQRKPDAGTIAKLRALDIAMWARMNPEMLAWATRLRSAGVKTAVLSNMQPEMGACLRQQAWTWDFECIVLSCEVRATKPYAEIYEACLRQLQVGPAEALFLDDAPANVEGARRLGIPAFCFSTIERLQRDLQGKDLPPLPLSKR